MSVVVRRPTEAQQARELERRVRRLEGRSVAAGGQGPPGPPGSAGIAALVSVAEYNNLPLNVQLALQYLYDLATTPLLLK